MRFFDSALEFAHSDQGILVLAQSVLNVACQANELLRAASRMKAQQRSDQLGRVPSSLGKFADFVKIFIGIGRCRSRAPFLSRRQAAVAARGKALPQDSLDASLKGGCTAACSSVFFRVWYRSLARLSHTACAACLRRSSSSLKRVRQRLQFYLVALWLRRGGPQAGNQDIQVAHQAQQPGHALQFSLDVFTPFFTDHVLECAELASKPASGCSKAMHPLPIATSGLGLVGFNARVTAAQCQHDRVTGRVARLYSGLKRHRSWRQSVTQSRSLSVSQAVRRRMMPHDSRRGFSRSAAPVPRTGVDSSPWRIARA